MFARLPAVMAAGLVLAAAPLAAHETARPQQAAAARPSLLEQMRADARLAIAAAVAAGNPAEALDSYDRFFASVKQHDSSLLAAVAKSVLTQVAADPASLSRIPALERLARAGDAKPRQALEAAAGGRDTLMPAGVEADCALARLGDSRAIDRLIQRLTDETSRDRAGVIGSLVDAKARRAAYAMVPLLDDQDPFARMTAAQGLAALGSREQVPALRAALERETHPGMRQSFAMALYALGSDAGNTVIAQAEASRIPDVRLVALEAYYAAKTPRWTALARQLLKSSSEGPRLRAAVMLGSADADARRALMQAATSTNLATREVGARLLEASGSRDTTLLLQLLRDPSPVTRTHAAGALLAGNP